MVFIVIVFFVMFIPWMLIVWVSHRTSRSGPIFFSVIGGGAAWVALCILSLIVLRIRFWMFSANTGQLVESPVLILVSCGFVGGLAYWLIGERKGK